MKNIKVLILVVSVFSFLSFQSVDKDLIVGKWEVVKLQDADGTINTVNGRWMEFKADGKLSGGNSLDRSDREGTWQYNAETKELTLASEKKMSGEGTYVITWVDNKTISFIVKRGRKIFMKKIN